MYMYKLHPPFLFGFPNPLKVREVNLCHYIINGRRYLKQSIRSEGNNSNHMHLLEKPRSTYIEFQILQCGNRFNLAIFFLSLFR